MREVSEECERRTFEKSVKRETRASLFPCPFLALEDNVRRDVAEGREGRARGERAT